MMTRVTLMLPDTMMGPMRAPIIWENEIEGEEELSITFPTNVRREDLVRMISEIAIALQQAEHRGERKAIAFLMGEGSGEPVGIVDGATVRARIGNLDGWRYCTMKVTSGDD